MGSIGFWLGFNRSFHLHGIFLLSIMIPWKSDVPWKSHEHEISSFLDRSWRRCRNALRWEGGSSFFMICISSYYPLIICYIAVENHHFQWENPFFLWPFSIALLNYQRIVLICPAPEKSCVANCHHQTVQLNPECNFPAFDGLHAKEQKYLIGPSWRLQEWGFN